MIFTGKSRIAKVCKFKAIGQRKVRYVARVVPMCNRVISLVRVGFGSSCSVQTCCSYIPRRFSGSVKLFNNR